MGNSPNQDFLFKEYEECFTQLRYYDDRETSFMKYYYALATAVISAQYALFKTLGRGTDDFNNSLIALSFVSFLAGVLFYVGMLRNRVYFVYAARQINALRGYLLSNDPGFGRNQMYTTIDVPTYSRRSLQSIEITGIALTSSLFGATMVFGIIARLALPAGMPISIGSFFIISAAQVWSGIRYLRRQNKKRSNATV